MVYCVVYATWTIQSLQRVNRRLCICVKFLCINYPSLYMFTSPKTKKTFPSPMCGTPFIIYIYDFNVRIYTYYVEYHTVWKCYIRTSTTDNIHTTVIITVKSHIFLFIFFPESVKFFPFAKLLSPKRQR